MRRLYKAILFLFVIFLPFFLTAQETQTSTPGPPQPLTIQGEIEDDNGSVNGAIVTVVQGGRTVTTITTGADGKYTFEVPLGNDY